MKRIICILALPLLLISDLCSQNAPIKFGDVDMADMLMTVYPSDTAAVAVILCDYGFFRAKTIQFTRLIRIKVLKKEGSAWANHAFPTGPNTTIKGVTSNLENGKLVQSKLKNESIFEERVTKQIYRSRIAMPNVKVGSVIDIQFNFPGLPSEWRFQETIPIKYCEFEIEPFPEVRFRYDFYGIEHPKMVSKDKWIAENMPSFKAEPYMNSEENYISKMEITLLEIIGYHDFGVTWDAVFYDLFYYDNFGKAMDLSGYLNDLAKNIKSKTPNPLDRMKMAYDSIRIKVRWDKNESLVTSTPTLSLAFKKKRGNSADINLMLVQLLKKIDLTVVPVVLSTRDNGILPPISPNYTRLNYVIARVTIGQDVFLLDATDEFRPYYLLPFRCLNYNGRTAQEKGSQAVELSTGRADKIITMYNLEMDEDQNLRGELLKINTDYAALNMRDKYYSFNSKDEYLEDLKKDKVGLTINDAIIDNLDSVYKSANENYKVTLSGKVNSIGSDLYILPMLYDQITENPLKSDTRKFPIDFGYKSERTVITTIKLPEGYNLKSLPLKTVLKMPDNSATFLYDAVETGKEVRITGKLTITKSLIPTEQYLNFREFYDQIIKKQSEPVVFKKL